MLEIEKKIQEILNNLDFVQYSFTKEAVEYFNKAFLHQSRWEDEVIENIFFTHAIENEDMSFSMRILTVYGKEHKERISPSFWNNKSDLNKILLLLIAEEKFIQTDENKDGETIEIQGHTYKLSLVK